jgi:hypothetical protein
VGIPPILRSRLALVLFLGVLLIPIGVSSLRGLTHVLTCDEEVNTPFTINLPEAGPPSITSSITLTAGEEQGKCGGLFLNMAVRSPEPDQLEIVLPIENRSDDTWRGSVELDLGGTTVPIDIGEIKAGRTVTDTVDLDVDPGTTDIEGSLLIGP